MTAPMLMSHHPTEEAIAAFVDDQDDSTARAAVTEHLASCGECRELVLMATDWKAVANVTPGKFGEGQGDEASSNVKQRRRGSIAAIAGLPAAAAIAIVVLQPIWLFGPDREDVVSATKEVNYGPSHGRPAGVPYKEPRPVTRSENKVELKGTNDLYVIYGDLDEQSDQHLIGLCRLLLDEGDAVGALDAALLKAPNKERDSIRIDLAAALLVRGREGDYQRALDLSNDVLAQKKSPEALWNRAEAIESLANNDQEAMRAWDDYLKIDPNSEWAEEARRNKKRLEPYP